MSNIVSGLIVVAFAALIGFMGLVVKVRFFPVKEEEEREDVAGYVTMVVGVIYALILALALVAVWENKDSAEGHVATESSALHELYLLGATMAPADQQRVQTAATAYEEYVVNTEWPKLRNGDEIDNTGWTLLTTLRTAVLTSDTGTTARQDVLSDATTQLSTLADARRGRLDDATKRMPPVLWIGLILGGILTIGLTFAYGIEQRFTHIGMVMGMVALIGFMLILIYNLENPFNHGLGADPEPFKRLFD
ncbi:hypothetical protein GCM10009839_90290 [Catenulispora yoronensis]|uniref:DUF4239 domain-containing protein n=1 Tax=Catenulispora yoronensis TaxID=450799 RepID=A0ABP5H4I5_9ACTN